MSTRSVFTFEGNNFLFGFFSPDQNILPKNKVELQDASRICLGVLISIFYREKKLFSYSQIAFFPSTIFELFIYMWVSQGGRNLCNFRPNHNVLIGRDHLKSLENPGKSGDFWGMPLSSSESFQIIFIRVRTLALRSSLMYFSVWIPWIPCPGPGQVGWGLTPRRWSQKTHSFSATLTVRKESWENKWLPINMSEEIKMLQLICFNKIMQPAQFPKLVTVFSASRYAINPS